MPKTRKYRILLASLGLMLLLGGLVILLGPEDYYVLEVDMEGEGRVSPGVGAPLYEPGATAILTAEPEADTGKGFVQWKGDVSGFEDSIQVEMNRHKKVTAVFAEVPAAGRTFNTLTIAVSGAGRGTTHPRPGRYRHLSGKEVMVRAFPGEGGYFAGWLVLYPERETDYPPGITGDASYSHVLCMKEDAVLIAQFASKGRVVVLEQEGCGTVSPELGAYALAEGVPLEVTAIPEKGWRLHHWVNEEETVLLEPETEQDIHVLKITGPGGTYRVVFEKAERRLLVRTALEGGALGRIEPKHYANTVPQRVPYGGAVDIRAIPENSDTAFAGWSGDVPEEFSNTQCLSPRLKLVMKEDREIEATFIEAETRLVVEAVVDGVQDERAAALLTPSPGTYGFVRNENTGMEFRASMAAGHSLAFAQWEGDIPEDAKADDFTIYLPMDRNRRVKARFVEQEALPVMLSHTGDGQGVTVPAPGRYALAPGRILSLKATPLENGAFGGWHIRGAGVPDYLSSENPVRVPVLHATDVEAFFGRTPCAISINSTDKKAETQPPQGDYWFAKGADIVLDAVVPAGVYFHHWASSTGEILSETPRTRIRITGDEGYMAVFGPPFYTLQVVAAGEGTGKIEADTARLDRVLAGKPLRLTARAAPDSVFSHWEGRFTDDAESTTSEIMVVMEKNKTITAYFDKADCQLTLNTTGLEEEEEVLLRPGSGTRGFRYGAQVHLEAYPPSDGTIAFLGWTGDSISPNPEQTLVMDRDRVVTANYGPPDKERTAALKVLQSKGTGTCRIHPLQSGTYLFSKGAEIQLTVAMAEGTYFGGWSHDYNGSIQYQGLPVVLDEDKTLAPVTSTSGGTLVLMLDTAEAGTTQPPPGVYRLADGMKVTLIARPTDDDYYFLGWHTPGGEKRSSRLQYTFSVSAAIPRLELIAVFRKYTAPPELLLCNHADTIRFADVTCKREAMETNEIEVLPSLP